MHHYPLSGADRCLAAREGERAEFRGHANYEKHHADFEQVSLGQADGSE
jgi:hypothetical protein